MYIGGGKVAVDSITTSALTSRIRMLAVAADDQGSAVGTTTRVIWWRISGELSAKSRAGSPRSS
jgi:hypothetical protein